MARYVYKVIPIQLLSAQFPNACRYRLEDPELEKSMAARGMVQPLLITARTPVVISGHKRIWAAKKLGIPQVEILQLEEALSKEDAFLLAVLSNWKQKMTELDQAWTVTQAVRTFGFSKERVLEEIYPPAGQWEGSGFYEEALEVMGLSKPLLDLIADARLPFRGARSLNRLSKPDQQVFASQIATPAALTTNQLLKGVEWLQDLLKISGQSLEGYFKKNADLEAILKSTLDRKAKGERFFSRLRNLRFPNLAEREKGFAALSSQLQKDQSGIFVEAPPFFEAEGFTVRARIKNAKDLGSLMRLLERKRKVLNSLLDIVL